MKRFKRKK